MATIAGDTTSLDTKITACNTTGLATEAGNLATIAGDTTSIDGKITACNTGAVVVSSGAITETNSSAISTAVAIPTGIGHGVTTVTTAGTDVVLASSTACKKVIIQAQTDNTGLIAIGASGVDATEATGTGVLLAAGEAVELEITNLATAYIDSTVNGDGVRYTYLT